jgi:protein-S-isoprenylcysteine O-methyltransferase Ste14
MISPYSAAAAIWLIWLVGWWLGALGTAKSVSRESPASQLSYTIFNWIGAVLLFFTPIRGGIFSRALYPPSQLVAWIAVIVVAIGLAYSVWARLHLGRLWSAVVTVKAEHRIIRTGPYTLTRHPIYTGMLLALLATVVVRDTVVSLIGCALIATGLVLKVRREERMLLDHFGADYQAYQQEVPRLVPRPWHRRTENV